MVEPAALAHPEVALGVSCHVVQIHTAQQAFRDLGRLVLLQLFDSGAVKIRPVEYGSIDVIHAVPFLHRHFNGIPALGGILGAGDGFILGGRLGFLNSVIYSFIGNYNAGIRHIARFGPAYDAVGAEINMPAGVAHLVYTVKFRVQA